MKILILGGTVFLGRHLAAAAVRRGHELTLFNRGQTNPDLFPDVLHLRGNRNGDLSSLEGRRWDAVIDTCGYIPRVVADSAALLSPLVGHYTFVSSISVYADINQPGLNENSRLGTLEDKTQEEITGESYGPLKVLCETAVETALPGRVLTVRPGLIVGPNDPSDRFTYWVKRMARGGEVLAPGHPGAPVQTIDVRDLAEWILKMAEADQKGIFNATGPAEPLTMGDMLITAASVGRSRADLTWVDETFVIEQGIEPWIQLPLWVPAGEGDGWAQVDFRRALDKGLTFRPLVETMSDTLAWAAGRPPDYKWLAGLRAERETELLQAWRSRTTP
jgi:2'-hydroxyisoflavone reductase